MRAMRIDFVTLFPEMVLNAVDHSILKRASQADLVEFDAVNPRDFTTDKHRTVDDNPYGGGPGMLMKCEPLAAAIDSLDLEEDTAIVLTDPTGSLFTQAIARELSERQHVVFLCGHYEGIDDRIRELYATHTLSIGDYVLTGGELPSLVMADAIVRLLPGALGSPDSLEADSFHDALLSAPQYTRPEEFRGLKVPEVLLSGHHEHIRKWRREQSLLLTKRRRPDLLSSANLDKLEENMLSFDA
jgi:tRNA (guanine37-N1)-methyltransferase